MSERVSNEVLKMAKQHTTFPYNHIIDELIERRAAEKAQEPVAWTVMIDALNEALRCGYLFGEHNEPVDAYGKRLIRVIIVAMEGQMASSPVAQDSETVRDAARYRAICDPSLARGDAHGSVICAMWQTINALESTKTDIDAAIDAALAASKEQPK